MEVVVQVLRKVTMPKSVMVWFWIGRMDSVRLEYPANDGAASSELARRRVTTERTGHLLYLGLATSSGS
jgi:hypothetical protein